MGMDMDAARRRDYAPRTWTTGESHEALLCTCPVYTYDVRSITASRFSCDLLGHRVELRQISPHSKAVYPALGTGTGSKLQVTNVCPKKRVLQALQRWV